MELSRDDRDPDRVAILLPGVGYTATMPLLWFTRLTLADRGWTTVAVSWQPPSWAEPRRWVGGQLAEVLSTLHARRLLIVGKSLGSLAAVSTTDLPAIWLTPLMAQIAHAVRESRAPALVIGGTADDAWDSESAHRTGKEVLEIDGADHSMQHAGSVDRSIQTLGRVAAAVDAFAVRLAA